jgi:predicted transcriptional regulator
MAMTLRLTDEENARLDALAAAEGRSKQEILRLALADRWARVLPRYRGLLDRLGPA